MTRSVLRLATVLIAFAIGASGCIPKGKYDESLAHAASLAEELTATQAALQQAEQQGLDLTASLEAERLRTGELSALVDELEGRNAELKEKLGELSGLVADLGSRSRADKARKAELEALISSLQDTSASTSQSLSDAHDRIVALEEESARLAAEKAAAVEKSQAYADLARDLSAEIEEGQITITELSGKLTVSLSNAILFDSGSIELKQEGKDALAKVAGILAGVSDRGIRVEGHTDNVPVRAGAAYRDNWDLASLRASTVVRLLVEAGVDPLNIATEGFGEHRPVASNEEPEGRAANRRTEIVLVPKLAVVPD